MKMKLPKDQFLSTVRVGDKGQIVIPKEVRDLFEIEPGDSLLLMADKKSLRQGRQAREGQGEAGQ